MIYHQIILQDLGAKVRYEPIGKIIIVNVVISLPVAWPLRFSTGLGFLLEYHSVVAKFKLIQKTQMRTVDVFISEENKITKAVTAVTSFGDLYIVSLRSMFDVGCFFDTFTAAAT